jgi:hypothetical protein
MRLLRAAVFTAVCVVLSAAGHTLAAGHSPAVWKLLAAWPTVFAVAAPLAGRERRLPGIATGLAVGQTALHLLFSAGEMCARHTAARPTDGVLALAARLRCADQGAPLTPGAAERVVRRAGLDPARLADPATGAGHTAHAGVPHSPSYPLSMLLGHVLAALAAGWLLRRADAALWRLAELSASVVRRAFELVWVLVAGDLADGHRTPRPSGRFGHGYRPGPPHTTLLRHSVARRGPPAAAVAA